MSYTGVFDVFCFWQKADISVSPWLFFSLCHHELLLLGVMFQHGSVTRILPLHQEMAHSPFTSKNDLSLMVILHRHSTSGPEIGYTGILTDHCDTLYLVFCPAGDVIYSGA